MGEEQIDNLIDNIEHIKKALILGDAVVDFKKKYKNPVKRVEDREDVRELISYYIDLKSLEVPLVIEGLSFLDEKSNFLLLKLVEESNFPVVLLSRFDNISAVMLSRIKEVIKYNKKEVDSELLNPKTGIDVIKDKLSEDSNYFDRVKYISDISPQIFYFDSYLSNVRRNRNKIRDVILK